MKRVERIDRHSFAFAIFSHFSLAFFFFVASKLLSFIIGPVWLFLSIPTILSLLYRIYILSLNLANKISIENSILSHFHLDRSIDRWVDGPNDRYINTHLSISIIGLKRFILSARWHQSNLKCVDLASFIVFCVYTIYIFFCITQRRLSDSALFIFHWFKWFLYKKNQLTAIDFYCRLAMAIAVLLLMDFHCN